MDSRRVSNNVVKRISGAGQPAADKIRACKVKIDDYIKLVETNINGHLNSCMQIQETGDIVDTCNCCYYIHVYPIQLIHEILSIFTGQG